MRPEQVTDFKRELASLSDTSEGEELLERVESLFERYALAADVWRLEQRHRRKCKAPVVPIATNSSPTSLRTSGYKTYSGGTAYLLSGGSVNVGWCPEFNALLYRWESWTEEDTYLRIPGGRSLHIDFLTPGMLVAFLNDYGLHYVFTEEELGDDEVPSGG